MNLMMILPLFSTLGIGMMPAYLIAKPRKQIAKVKERFHGNYFRECSRNLQGVESGDGAAFFERVADDVDWTVMGTHPLVGHYRSKKAFTEGTFAKLSQVLPHGAQLHVEDLIVKDDEAVVELHSLATAKNGMRFDNRYCWWFISVRD